MSIKRRNVREIRPRIIVQPRARNVVRNINLYDTKSVTRAKISTPQLLTKRSQLARDANKVELLEDAPLVDLFIYTGYAKSSPSQSVEPVKSISTIGDNANIPEILSKTVKLFASGQASEVINGRAAMVGFTAAWVNEMYSGNSVLSQLCNTPEVGVWRQFFSLQTGFCLLFLTIFITVIASILPQLRGQALNGLNVPAKSFGPFTTLAEIRHGRGAMIGLALLASIESVSGTALL